MCVCVCMCLCVCVCRQPVARVGYCTSVQVLAEARSVVSPEEFIKVATKLASGDTDELEIKSLHTLMHDAGVAGAKPLKIKKNVEARQSQ
jgi:hypothetical protein